MPVNPVGSIISSVEAYKAIQDAVEVAKENDSASLTLREKWKHVALLIQSCIEIGFDSHVPSLQQAYVLHMDKAAATLIETRNIWYDYLLESKLWKLAKAGSYKRNLEITFKNLDDVAQGLNRIVTMDMYSRSKALPTGGPSTYVKVELPSYVTSLLTTSAADSSRTRPNAKAVKLCAKLARGSHEEQIHATRALNRALYSQKLTARDIVQAGGLDMIHLLDCGEPDLSTDAAEVLKTLASHDDNKITIAMLGGIPPLIRLLDNGTELGKEHAAGALLLLSINSDNQVIIAKEGGIPPLIRLLDNGTELGKADAAGALWNLANCSDDNKVFIAREDGIPPLIRLLDNGIATGKAHAAGALWALATNSDDNKVFIAKEGGIPPLLHLLENGIELGKEKAAGALLQLAVNRDCRVIIAKEGGIPPLIRLLDNGTEQGKATAAGALWNLAVNSDNKVIIAKKGGIPPLIRLLDNGIEEGKENAAGALLHLADNNDNKVIITKEGGIPPLRRLADHGTDEGKQYAADTLHRLAQQQSKWGMPFNWLFPLS